MSVLPSCFKPTDECRQALEDVRDGKEISNEDLTRYLAVGFIKLNYDIRDEYAGLALTNLGREALCR